MTYSLPLPDISDPVTREFWQAARESRLLLERCSACGVVRWPPSPLCPECWSDSYDRVDVRPTGTLWSYAVYHRAMSPAFKDAVPYVVVAVQLDDGPLMFGTATSEQGTFGHIAQLQIGDRMEAVFDHVTAETTLIRWRRADGDAVEEPRS